MRRHFSTKVNLPGLKSDEQIRTLVNDEMSEMERNEGDDELGFADKDVDVVGLTTYAGDKHI